MEELSFWELAIKTAGDFLPTYAVAWAAGSVALFRFTRLVTAAAVPGFPRDFLAMLSGSRKLAVSDFGSVFVSQMDRLFRFAKRTVGRRTLYLPSFARSVLASVATIIFVSLVLTLGGFGVWREAVGFLTGESISEAVAGVSSIGVSEQLRDLHLVMGLVTGGIALLINLYADYFSIAQTRYFIERSKTAKGANSLLVVALDFAVSVAILLVSVTLGLLATCILMYFAGFFIWDTFSEYFRYLFVPSLAVSFSLLYDSIALLFGGSEISEDVIAYMIQWSGVAIGFPTPKFIFLTWVCSSLLTSAWLWLNLSAIGLARVVSFVPTVANALIKWTRAKEDPDRLVATFIVVAWSIVWMLPFGGVKG